MGGIFIYSPDVIEEVRIRNDVVELIGSYVSLVRKGAYHFGLCPFHKEKSASFSVSQERQGFYCFGCGAAGNVFTFLMKLENYTFLEALSFLANRAGYKLPEKTSTPAAKKNAQLRERLYEVNKIAARFFYDNLISSSGSVALDYLSKRMLSPQTIKRFGLGYSPSDRKALYNHLLSSNVDMELMEQSGLVKFDNNVRDMFSGRLIFPIIDTANRVVGFGGRILSGEGPKYINSKETLVFEKSRVLYGLNIAKKSRTDRLLLVEGYMDVCSLHQHGFNNAVAALGTAFNKEHARVLKQYTKSVTLSFDGDTAGVTAALRAIPVLVDGGLHVNVLSQDLAKDPDELIKEYGASRFAEVLSGALYYPDFQLNHIMKGFDLSNTEQKILFVTEAAKILSALQNPVEQDAYVKKVSSLTNIAEGAIQKEMIKHSPSLAFDNKSINNTFYQKNANKTEDRGLITAKRNILTIIANNGNIRKNLSQILTPQEFCTEPFMRLFTIITAAEKERIELSELPSYFETTDEQSYVAGLFYNPQNKSEPQDMDEETLNQMINDWVYVIKTAYYKFCLQNAGDNMEEIIKMTEYKKSLGILKGDTKA